MEQYYVKGMSCAACQARVENAVNHVEGVTSCAVSLLTNSMGVEGTASSDAIIHAVKKAGYEAGLIDSTNKEDSQEEGNSAEEAMLLNSEIPELRKRLILSGICLFFLLYITMGVMLFSAPLPPVLNNNPVGLLGVQMVLSLLVLVINHAFFGKGFRALFSLSPNMDTLVALGSSVSYLWSFGTFLYYTYLLSIGTEEHVLKEIYMHQVYFESAAMIPTLISIGKLLEAKAKGRTTDAIKSLLNLAPKTAHILKGNTEETVPVKDVKPDDYFVVYPGESVPVDGEIISGNASMNESALTGESVPVDKTKGDFVFAATINQSGNFTARATRVGKDTTLGQIIRLVRESATTKAPIARIADRVSGIFVPIVIGISLSVFLIWMLLGATAGEAVARAVCVLVISCPCALGLATPVAIMVGNGLGAKNGILFKTGEALENLGRIDILALDKTGTITMGNPVVTGVFSENITEEELLSLAASVEKKSEHPLAKAVVEYAQKTLSSIPDCTEFKTYSGTGVEGIVNGKQIRIGNGKFIRPALKDQNAYISEEEQFSADGNTPILVESDGKLLGIIAIADQIREDSSKAIRALSNLGIAVVMLTGDNKQTAKKIAKEAGVDYTFSDVLPNEKAEVIRKLKTVGRVAMVGDGINDAPALTVADVGLAIGAGTDVAIDSANVILMNSNLTDVVRAVNLSRKTIQNIRQNLFWAFFYNLLCIPLAAGAFVVKMDPMFGAAAMSLSSVTVCLNALRLNLVSLDKNAKRRNQKKSVVDAIFALGIQGEKEDNKEKTDGGRKMEKVTIRVDGMMCAHCEANVKQALEALDFVNEATPNHETGTVELSVNGEVDFEILKATIEEKGYKYAD